MHQDFHTLKNKDKNSISASSHPDEFLYLAICLSEWILISSGKKE